MSTLKRPFPSIQMMILLFLPMLAFGQKSSLKKVKDLIIYQDTAFYAAFPSIIRTNNEDFLLAFRRAPNRKVFGEKSNHHVDPNSYLVTLRSEDGLNWSKEPELLYAHAFGGSQDPCMVKLSDGTIICTSYGWAKIDPEGVENLKEPYFENRNGFVFLGGYLLRSEDDGKSWQGPIYPPNLPAEDRFDALGRPLPAYNRGAMCEGRDGRLYWVVAGRIKGSTKTSTHLLISNDQGMTWNYSCVVAANKDISFNESSIYETPDGDLVVFMRTSGYDDQACIARSTDGGKSFQPWEKMGFQGHPFHALQLSNGGVLLVYGYRHEPYGIRARLLNEECTNLSTTTELVIRDDGGTTDLGYPWAVQINENKALVVYYFNVDDQIRHIAGSVIEF